MATSFQVVFDCADPRRVGMFWATALGYQEQAPPTGYGSWEEFLAAQGMPESEWSSAYAVVDPDGIGSRMYFQRVPEAKAGKNRLHLDINASGGPGTALDLRRKRVGDEVARLVAAGATETGPHDVHGEYWFVMQDPEGNEFCVQ